MKIKLVNGIECIRRESVVGHVEEIQNWNGTPNYTAQVIRLIDQDVRTGAIVKQAFTWRYTNRRMDSWKYGKPCQTIELAKAAYYAWLETWGN